MEVWYEMSASDYGLLFSFVLLVFMVFHGIHLANYEAIQMKQMEYNLAIDEAVEAALFDSVEFDSVYSIGINEEMVLERFFDALSMNLGVMGCPDKKEILRECVPFALFVEQDGIIPYIQKSSRYEKEVLFQSGRKYKYQWTGEHGDVLLVTLSDFVKYDNEKSSIHLEGNYMDLAEQLPEYFHWTKEEFAEKKNLLIVQQIKECSRECVNYQNRIARKNGIVYQFELPVIEYEEWYRTIRDMSMLVVFQDYPFGKGMTGTYNRVAIGGARIAKRKETV